MSKFVRVDEWAGYVTKEMYDKEFADAIAANPKKKDDIIKFYKAMDLSSLAKSKDDVWIINEHPNIRINFNKCLPKSVRRGLFESEEEQRDAETFTVGRKAFQNKFILLHKNYLSW